MIKQDNSHGQCPQPLDVFAVIATCDAAARPEACCCGQSIRAHRNYLALSTKSREFSYFDRRQTILS